jgi:hypothetical protein
MEKMELLNVKWSLTLKAFAHFQIDFQVNPDASVIKLFTVANNAPVL